MVCLHRQTSGVFSFLTLCLAVTFISVMEITMFQFKQEVPFKTNPIPIIKLDRKTGIITQKPVGSLQAIMPTFFGEGGGHE
jgi:hypothetical protein